MAHRLRNPGLEDRDLTAARYIEKIRCSIGIGKTPIPGVPNLYLSESYFVGT